MVEGRPARRELILGGQRSGKSDRAESLAMAWLALAPEHRAVLVATARAGDEEMRRRIRRHREDRARRLPALLSVEEPLALASCLASHGGADTMVLVDCLTLWLTNLLMPADPLPGQALPQAASAGSARPVADLLACLTAMPGPVVLVSNEIGLGVVPLGRDTRGFVDELGRLNQAVAQACDRVTLMVAGLPLCLKGQP